MMPLISIIIPVYNTEKYLRRCIDSVIAQSYSDWELILVDDGSTDESGKICDEYAETDERIRVFHKANGGVSSARNVGLDNATGEWVTFVDSDDYLQSDALVQYIEMISDDVEMVMAGYRILDEKSNETFSCDKIEKKIIDRKQGLIEMYNSSDFPYQGYIWCKLLKVSIIRQYKLTFNNDIFFNEDRLFMVEYLSHIGKKIAYSTCVVYNYFELSTGVMASLKKGYNKKFVTDFDAFVLMKKAIQQLPETEQLIPFADKGIRDSYDWNHAMMYKFNDYSAYNHWHMVCGLIKTGIFVDYLKELLVPLAMFLYPKYFCRER